MRIALGLAIAFVVACVACGSSTPAAVSAPPRTQVVATSTATPAASTSAATPASAAAPVLRIALTDVRSGESFTLDGFAGKTVIVEGMAVW